MRSVRSLEGAPLARPRPGALLAAAATLVAVAAAAAPFGQRLPLLVAIGAALGFVLARFSFGFAGAVRQLLERRDDAGAQAILLMVGAATLAFAPLLAAGTVLGRPVAGAVAPAGFAVAIGAFVFGAGMQLAGGCASGTLYAAGTGAGRTLITLAAFCLGGFWASLHMAHWARLPAPPPLALGEQLGWAPGVALQLAVIAALAVLARRVARGPLRSDAVRPLAAAAILLALLNAATLAVAGHPWSITWGFTLWAAKLAQALGWDPNASPFWAGGFARDALDAPVFADVTTAMNVAIVAGAMLAAAATGRLRWSRPGGWRLGAAAALGGLAMGYGARLAYGCNVGAFFSGAASTSLHGWLWLAAALPGSWVGMRLRPWFGMRR